MTAKQVEIQVGTGEGTRTSTKVDSGPEGGLTGVIRMNHGWPEDQ